MEPIDYCVCLIVLLTIVGTWAPTARQYKTEPWWLVPAMLRFAYKSYHWWLIQLSVGLLGLYLLRPYVPLFANYSPPLPLSVVLGQSIIVLNLVCLPPAVIFLTTSNLSTSTKFYTLGYSILPLRVVALLRDYTHAPFGLNLNNFRTLRGGDKEWQSVVHPMIDFVPIVVLDARADTDGVVHETQRVLMSRWLGKTIFIVGPSGECPAIDMAVSLADPESAIRSVDLSRLRKIRIDELIPTIRAVTSRAK